MNPTELAARLRTIVLRLGFLLGVIILVVELWRWLIAPGGTQPATLGEFKQDGFKVFDVGADNFWIWEQTKAGLDGLPFFLAVPLWALLVVVVIFFAYTKLVVPAFHFGARIFALVTGYDTKNRRHIIVCTDGTWNHPEEIEGGIIKSSNVYKFWDNLKGERMKFVELTCGADRVKHHRCKDGTVQVGLYYPGVGNPATYSRLGVILGGATGYGAKGIMREAYRDIIRYYHPGDKITIVGFSRGAAVARWLAAYIGKNGVTRLTISDTALGKFVVKLLRALGVGVADKRDVRVDFLGVWDTVASFGLGKNVLGIPFQRVNLFKDFNVSHSVRRVVHLLAIDEQRDAFVPTPVEPPKPGSEPSDTIIEEVWFPGVHSNVGGGFLGDGLSDIALGYMIERFQTHFKEDNVDIELKTTDFGSLEDNIKSPLRPSSSGIYDMVPRPLPDDAVLHESVFKKMALTCKPVVNPEETEDLEYAPPNVIALMKRLEQRETDARHYLERLRAADLISDDELAGAGGALSAACKLRTVPKVAGEPVRKSKQG